VSVVIKKKSEKNKMYALGALALVAAYLMWSNLGSDQPSAPAAGDSARPATPVAVIEPGAAGPRRGITARGSAEFRPRLGSKRPEDRIDPNKVDPTLRLDLLAKVQSVTLEGGSRNLFQFGVAAPVVPTTPIPKVPKIPVNGSIASAAPPVAPGPPPVPQAPPIPLKYYGFTNAKNEPRKKAFFLDGEDILVAREGDTLKSRYKVVRIGVNSVEMEDTQFKTKQTLPLEAELAG
jgi:hypothetical protein